MHSLLERQLQKHVGDPDSIPSQWQDLIEAVSQAYHQADEDRELLERSLDLTSEELLERNERLREELARREEAEQQLQTYAERQTAIAQLGQLTLRGISIQAVVSEALSMIARILDVPYCSLLRFRPEAGRFELQAGVGWADEKIGTTTFTTDGNIQAVRAVKAGTPVVVKAFSDDPDVEPGPHLSGKTVESGAAIVIGGQKEPWGVLGAHDTKARDFSKEDVDFLQSVANVLAQGIQRRQANRLLQESESKFRAVSENAAELIAILNREGEVLHAYGAAESITGFTAETLKDLDGMERIHSEDRHELLEMLLKGWRNPGEIIEAEFRFKHREGEWRHLSVQGRNLIDQPGVNGILVSVRDVTQRRQFERELIQAKDQAEEMVQLKNAFLANMSHEIRTPLTAIMGFADELVEMTSGAEKKFAERIRDGGQRLSKTLNSVLALARLEANESELELGAVELCGVVDETAELFQSMVDQEGLDLCVEMSKEPIWVLADRNALCRILSNLLSNAVKFTEDGTVRVRVDEHGDTVSLQVEDTGIGIGEEFQDALFDEFKQESTGRDRDYEGTGLGLTITERLVKLMDGDISVDSKKEEGSVFTVQISALESPRPSDAP